MLKSLFAQIFILFLKFKIINLTESFKNEFTVFKSFPPSPSPALPVLHVYTHTVLNAVNVDRMSMCLGLMS